MNNNASMIITAVCVAAGFFGFAANQIGFSMGKSWERGRIYDQCLAVHSSMIHRDAVVKCKEIVK